MKPFKFALVFSLAATGFSLAASVVSYSASGSPSANPDANSGTVNVWSTSTIGSNSGFFSGDSANNGGAAGAGTSAWAMYANSSSEAFATHTLQGGALTVGQSISLDFDNGFIDTSKSAGIQLFSGTTLVFQFYFRGGETYYEYYDNGGWDQDTSAGFTRDGGTFEFTLNSATSYEASFRSATWTGSIANLAIDKVQVYNNSAGSGSSNDVYFNNLTVVPEPSAALLGGLGALALLRRRRA